MADPTIQRRNRANKRRGATWEISLTDFFRNRGHAAERLPKMGRLDQGDIAVQDTYGTILIEAKDAKAMSLRSWLAEAEEEAANYVAVRPGVRREDVQAVVIVKDREEPIERAIVVMRLSEYLTLPAVEAAT